MSRLHLEILFGVLFVTVGTAAALYFLADFDAFWSPRKLWDGGLLVALAVVSVGYWHQGLVIRRAKSARNMSLALPCAVFVVQCLLFIKGVIYHDAALLAGALLVNSSVVFLIYQILRCKR